MNQSLPTRAFREHIELNQLKRQAKELLDAFRAGEAAASREVNAHFRDADADTFALHDAQLVLARPRIRELAETEGVRGRHHRQESR